MRTRSTSSGTATSRRSEAAVRSERRDAERRAAPWQVALAGAGIVWSALILLTPAWRQPAIGDAAGPRTVLVGLVYLTGARLCHQRPERSFHRHGHALPVCGRCTGLYLAGTLGLLVALGRRSRPPAARPPVVLPTVWPAALEPRVAWLVLAALPTLVTWSLEVAGVWDPGTWLRAMAALPLGATAGALIGARRL